ncbi:hypothetical protein FDENT_9656 [Fusarium denticulatum]|uniref:Uncharacterized protein n=1 Tax=Fusarium denticulatum TaxID=48507 RepID=A0A8H5TUG8_9HYPO|nr:hypothetical protein FDENT_9656 [Fusarium denticulatum]
MDEPRPEDKNIEITVWQAAIAAMEENLGTIYPFDKNVVAGDMRLCAGQIQRYHHAEGETPQRTASGLQIWLVLPSSARSFLLKPSSWTSLRRAPHQLNMADNQERTQAEDPAVEEKVNSTAHRPRTPRPSSPISASTPPTRCAFAAPLGTSRCNQHGGAGSIAYPPGDASSQGGEDESWLGAASDGFEPLPSSPDDSQVPQTDHDVEELLTPENFAKYKRYRRREKRAGRV